MRNRNVISMEFTFLPFCIIIGKKRKFLRILIETNSIGCRTDNHV